ncbi:MAG: preprotein translocase subunit SecA [Chloroflexi bacterium]|nr:preprotein translocase subunit SecA [Chloroflexota bacterium]
MLSKLLKRLFGDPNVREVQRLQPMVDDINALEPEMQRLGDEALRALTDEFRARLQGVTDEHHRRINELTEELDRESDADERRSLRLALERARDDLDKSERAVLDEILPRAYAAVREAAVRAVGLRHFDVQMIGGIVLHQGRIAEMKTGEGKTLVATLPLYLNALTGRGVHLVTPNDYLSKHGAQWMGPVYHLLGLSVGVVQSMGENPALSSFVYDPHYAADDDRYQHLRPVSRAEAYRADVLYGTNNEFGFDYLRDNMVMDLEQCVQRELYFAIVDEVDNILIDEARTPLIISGQAEESTSEYRRFAAMVRSLKPEADYTIDEKLRVVTITDEGLNKVERALGIDNLYAPEHSELTPYLDNALKAKALFAKDRDYVVAPNGEVIIVDEFTGRMMYGRRYSDGLHQAIEAKEGVQVRRESLTLATITFQNYFRMYRRLAGMTGTALTEAEEFGQIYNLEVVAIPTHKPMVRDDHADVVYKNADAKFRAALAEIQECHDRGQPVLVGTLSIETSEMLSQRLTRMGIPHEVLNAKQHEREAQIIAQAGRPGAVTIATNMAGRGVDILLGGNPEGTARDELRRQGQDLQEVDEDVWAEALARAEEQCAAERERVLEAGGLHVLGTERYEARRIDNQLRGRAGRQGDPGSSRFYVALEDDLMRRFGGSSLARIMERFGVDEDIPIEHDLVTKSLEGAQTRVEGHNFDLRKHLLEYDDVVNQQRQVIYEQRRLVLSEATVRPVVLEILRDQVQDLVMTFTAGDEEDWDLESLHTQVDRYIHLPADHAARDWENLSRQQIADEVAELTEEGYVLREEAVGEEQMRHLETVLMLGAIDRRWVRHLTALDELRDGIGLRAIGQRNPLVEYKREAFAMFEQLMEDIQSDVAQMILNAQIQQRRPTLPVRNVQYAGATGGSAGSERPQPARSSKKVGRNDPCPCGSGKKYKQCCLREGLSPEEAAAKRAPVGAGRG